MRDFDYTLPAELFLRRVGAGGKRLVYRRFVSAAAAVQFAVEGTAAFSAVTMEIDGERYERVDIRRLYDAPGYPLARKFPAAA